MLEVRNLNAGYGRVPVLHDISLDVRPGEVVLVLGGNGAGKSTLLRSIAGFIKPTRGTVMLEGRDITGQSPEVNARHGLRLILDGHRVFPELSVADNIRLGAAVRRDGGDFQALAGPVLDFFPILRTKLKVAARDLSGGQQQMLALAQAFVARPAVLLCDDRRPRSRHRAWRDHALGHCGGTQAGPPRSGHLSRLERCGPCALTLALSRRS